MADFSSSVTQAAPSSGYLTHFVTAVCGQKHRNRAQLTRRAFSTHTLTRTERLSLHGAHCRGRDFGRSTSRAAPGFLAPVPESFSIILTNLRPDATRLSHIAELEADLPVVPRPPILFTAAVTADLSDDVHMSAITCSPRIQSFGRYRRACRINSVIVGRKWDKCARFSVCA